MVGGGRSAKAISTPRIHFCNSINFDLVADECDLFVNNANLSSTIRMLSHGTPVIVVPRFLEHRVNASNLVAHRLGLVADPIGGDLPNVLQLIRSDSLTKSVHRFASDYQSRYQHASRKVCDKIMSLMG